MHASPMLMKIDYSFKFIYQTQSKQGPVQPPVLHGEFDGRSLSTVEVNIYGPKIACIFDPKLHAINCINWVVISHLCTDFRTKCLSVFACL